MFTVLTGILLDTPFLFSTSNDFKIYKEKDKKYIISYFSTKWSKQTQFQPYFLQWQVWLCALDG